MARVHKSSVFEGREKSWGDEDALARKQLVIVEPPIDHSLAWHAGTGEAKNITVEDLGIIETRHSEIIADTRLGSLILLSESNAGDSQIPDDEFTAAGATRLTKAVAQLATLASMGTTASAQPPVHKASLDAGMAIIFPGATIVGPEQPPAPLPI